jgi:hypothetical protein
MTKPDQAQIASQLTSLAGSYLSIQKLGQRLLKYGWHSHAGGLQIGHRPWVAPENYALLLFSPASQEWIGGFERRYKRGIPPAIRDFLQTTNGCMEYGLSLFGLAPSMQGTPALLNRSKVQCHDLGLANTGWSQEYRPPPKNFHFGSRNFGWDDQLGYFIDEAGHIRSITRNKGKTQKEWEEFPEFLAHELDAAEQEERSYPKNWWKD